MKKNLFFWKKNDFTAPNFEMTSTGERLICFDLLEKHTDAQRSGNTHTFFPNQISKQCMHTLHSIVHKTVNKQDAKRVRLHIHKILYITTFRYLFYYSFCFHAIPVVSKYRKPVQLP